MGYRKFDKHGYQNGACLITEEKLEKFDKFIKEHIGETKYNAKTRDGLNIAFESFNELIKYDNFKKRRLIKLELNCSNEKSRLQVEFCEEFPFIPRTICYTLSYEDDFWGFKFDDDLINQLKVFKPWYSCITYFSEGVGIILSFILPLILIYIFAYNNNLTSNLIFDAVLNKSFASRFFSINNIINGLLYCLIFFSFFKFKKYLFPDSFIALGKQKENHKNRMMFAIGIIGAILLAIIGNLITIPVAKLLGIN